MNKHDKVRYLVERYLPNTASRAEKANQIRKYRHMLRDNITKVPIYGERFINSLEIISTYVTAIGCNWFKDIITGKCYHVIRCPKTSAFIVDTTRHSKIANAPKRANKSDTRIRKTYEEKHITIQCLDCGTDRIIKTCDAFQVKRCKTCQHIYKNKKRVCNIQRERLQRRIIRDRIKQDIEIRRQCGN